MPEFLQDSFALFIRFCVIALGALTLLCLGFYTLCQLPGWILTGLGYIFMFAAPVATVMLLDWAIKRKRKAG
jgi:hypothetical protein